MLHWSYVPEESPYKPQEKFPRSLQSSKTVSQSFLSLTKENRLTASRMRFAERKIENSNTLREFVETHRCYWPNHVLFLQVTQYMNEQRVRKQEALYCTDFLAKTSNVSKQPVMYYVSLALSWLRCSSD